MKSPVPFRLTISLNALEHLGINLYSNVPAVLAEIVGNAWDADASEVRIDWDRVRGQIIIRDDGIGMTPTEVNDRFLTVGYRRRDGQPGQTAKGRAPMGRKGIGKLSLFSVASVVQVETAKEGQKSALLMRLDDIRRRIQQEGGEGTYEPEPLPIEPIDFEHGTRITLSDLRRTLTIRTSKALRKRLARRFSVIGPEYDFRIVIDGEEVVPADREYYDKIQYIWTYGDQSSVVELCTIAEEVEERAGRPAQTGIIISGWLGTVRESKFLKDEDGDNLNHIAIFVRGKMAQEDILGDFSERGIYASYLLGELRVEGLDRYDGPGTDPDDDAATSSRQRIVEDDNRYAELKQIVGDELKYIQNRWAALRGQEGEKKALQIPAVKAWLEQLKPPIRVKASRWLGKINRINMDDIEDQKRLLKHAVLAFEFYHCNENLEALDQIADHNLNAALQIFEELDGLEANLYGQIVQQRIQVIRTLQEKVDANARERAIQEYLFDHLWLLDPSWERTEGTEFMEGRVQRMFAEIDAQLTDEERRGRLDIAYRKTAGQHVIIELKRPERVVAVPDLMRQGEKYVSGMTRLLEAQGNPHEPITVVFLLGKPPTEWANPGGQRRGEQALQSLPARIVYYDQLLGNAFQSYRDYLERREVVDRLGAVIRAIEDYAAVPQAITSR